MNNREIFDHVKAHLLNQGKPSITNHMNSDECAYRGDNGLMCAIGCLIKDEFYNVDFEGGTIDQEEILQAVESSLGRKFNNEDLIFLRKFQRIHDEGSFLSEDKWKEDVIHNLNDLEKEYFGG